MGSNKQHFVLVHGAGHGAWCWVKVIAALERAGHRATAIDLLGAGENRDVEAEDITSGEQYDTPLATFFESLPDHEKVILVGHSMGGNSISRMSEKYPKKICLAVYVAAFMPGIGKEYTKIMNEFEVFIGLDLENVSSLPRALKITPEIAKDAYNKSSHEDYLYACERFRSHAPLCSVPPNYLTEENYGSVPKICVLALDDRIILPKNLRKMVEMNPPNGSFEIEGDHSLFFSAVERLDTILNNVATKYGA